MKKNKPIRETEAKHEKSFVDQRNSFQKKRLYEMRPKRAKQYKKCMAVYKYGYNFREPYQVLLITNCSLQDLRDGGERTIGGLVMSRKYERRRCTHNKPVPGIQCIEEIIGEENKFNYCIGVQDNDLRKKLRKIEGIPIVHVNRSVLILEPPSDLTKAKYKELENGKMGISVEEAKRLETINPKEKKVTVPKRKKKIKGPNPLSVKKKSIKPSPQKRKAEEEPITPKKPRKRSRKPKNIDNPTDQ
ncbi:hypothetical protein BB558_007334 [Smittium angustum]|uniref:UTP23 sensor motif region domain-containing protein n=1 Tax=Smittium angustum TaxID=133377 RepID=A0A2U1IV95_SMIAN|nr:hypothetical protein BB558_007334 [Smittium angustum]